MAPSKKKSLRHEINLSTWFAFLSNIDEETRTVYARALKQFCEVNGFKSLEDAAAFGDERHFSAFILNLKDRGAAPNTVRLYATGVRRFFEAVKRPLNPFDVKLAVPKRRQIRETNAIPPELVRDIILAAPQGKRLLLHFLWATGLRIGEALSLKKKDFSLDSYPAKLTVITEKTHKPRVVFIPEDLAKKLGEHLSKLSDDDYVFHVEDDVRKPLNRDKVGEMFRGVLARLEMLKRDSSGRGYKYTLHSFRRSYETTLASCGVHPMTIKFLLGHTQGVEDSYLRLSEKELAAEWQKAENALRLDLKQPINQDYVRQLEERLTHALERIIKLETLLLKSRDIELRTLTDELKAGDEVFKQEPSYVKLRKSSKI
jgi:integrase